MKRLSVVTFAAFLLFIAAARYTPSPRPITEAKRYVALLTQCGESAPTAIVLINTLGGEVVWTRTGAGQYDGTLEGAFPNERTFPLMPVTADPLNSDMRTLIRNSDDSIQIVTNSADCNLNAGIGDGVDITVYPEQ